MWVLPSDQQSVTDDVRGPVSPLRESGPQLQHLVFDKEGDRLGEAGRFFLAIGEPGDFFVLDQDLAVRRLDVTQCAGGMTHDGGRLAAGGKGLNRFDEMASSARSHIGPWPPG